MLDKRGMFLHSLFYSLCEENTPWIRYKSTLSFYQKIFITLRSRVQIPVSLHANQGLTLNRGSFVVFAWGFYSKFRYVKMTILYLSILVSLFWLASRFINLYQFALVGAIFEILWLPMILMVFCLPLISFYYLFKEKFSVNSTYLYAILIMIFTFLIILFFK